MARVTISLEGSMEEIFPVLQKLSAIEVGAAVPPSSDGTQPAQDWTAPQVREVWESLRPDAQRILKECAREAEGIARNTLQQILSLDARQIGARLSSLGHNLRRHGYRKSHAHPLIQEDGRYRLESVWRETIIGL